MSTTANYPIRDKESDAMNDSRIVDAADRANVSVATVCRVLNGGKLVSEKTEEGCMRLLP
ncbi:LacI family DNA-binding transcriptional regulator [Paenibacillus sp. sptzw28]|uniref:LacI family DNA-binding transcriptional regulator n=1 Tax=Paenibacillus sp. sptzw28 TaxID=715179 RepID=UPI0021632C0C|nr:LacI family DNA-binding transcriptional regulator [Paenibacillus sp. sptzw28]